MATPMSVNWNRGPWATPRTMMQPMAGVAPSQMGPDTPGATQAFSSLIGNDLVGGSSGAPGAPQGSGWSGPMSPGMEARLGTRGALGLAQGALMGTNPAFAGGLLGMALASMLAREAGVPTEYDPMTGLTPTAIQEEQDYSGAYAGRAKEAQRQAALENAFIQQFGRPMPGPAGFGGLTGSTDYSPDPGTMATGMSVGEAAGIIGNQGYGPSDSGGGGGGGMGGSGGPGDAGDAAGGGSSGGTGGESAWGRGGVSKVRKPTRATYGEAGPEQAIFIPRMMQHPGMQGKERQVRKGLKSAYSSLTGGRQIKPGG